jgi:hypothetical protein
MGYDVFYQADRAEKRLMYALSLLVRKESHFMSVKATAT